ncbi:steroid receptor RNA activator 1-like isoform X2 [Thrips palmi]|uniref:Steroid receptor RNA activator 1-like isoform X2 n=1 Tax=Thrips palmi TaxID=161013 RepID=A0A6P9A4E2_THRPL|nr:steroid receptor RNA activator 1-like isoform X2 [Thrips palmi]
MEQSAAAEVVQRKGSIPDPGWNDPPNFSYDALNPATGPKRANLLNKRVAYPLASQSGTSPPSGGMNPTLPPSTVTTAVPPTILQGPFSGNRSRTSSESSSATNEPGPDKTETLSTVRSNLEEVVNRSYSLSATERTEIKKRIAVMQKMWEEDKLNSSVHRRLLELSHELKMGNVDHADHIHVGLMVDHPAMCSSWMVGVRKLVQHLKSDAPPPPAITAPIVSSPVPEGPTELVVVTTPNP